MPPHIIYLHNDTNTAMLTMWRIVADHIIATHPLATLSTLSFHTTMWQSIEQNGGRAAIVMKVSDIPDEVTSSPEAKDWLRCVSGNVLENSGIMARRREMQRRARGGDDWLDGSFGEKYTSVRPDERVYRILAWYIPVPMPMSRPPSEDLAQVERLQNETRRDSTVARERRLPEEGYSVNKQLSKLA